MVTKGLDFRDVKLVGVLNADGLLNFPDFRSHERCFQLLSQVAGRSGRTDVRGKVIIQTFNPYHSILQQVSSNDYDTMYKQQLEDRYQFHYPPIYRIVKISLRHRQIERVNKASDWFARALKNALRTGVLGPEFPPIARIRNQYHKNILIKIAPAQSLTKTKEAIQKIENSFLGIKDFRAVRIVINVDSY
jgi:primosomal protein N' (replication factor Y)